MPRLSGRLVRPQRLALLAAAVCAALSTPPVQARDSRARQSLLECRKQAVIAERVACYDRTVEEFFMHDFEGIGTGRTPVFPQPQPFQVVYENNDVIFVIYVYRANGELITSYGTGPGKGTLDINESGKFYIDIRATGSWRLTLRSLAPAPAQPPRSQIKEYQLRRLAIYQSECNPGKVFRALNAFSELPEDLQADAADSQQGAWFHLDCQNQTFYPHGLYVACTDPDDERSCRLLSEAQSFDQLKLLQ